MKDSTDDEQSAWIRVRETFLKGVLPVLGEARRGVMAIEPSAIGQLAECDLTVR